MRAWADHAPRANRIDDFAGGAVVTAVRSGIDLVLCDLPAGEGEPFSHEEEHDLIGMGFHLKGGTRFDIDHDGFRTAADDCWICAAPTGTGCVFTPAEDGLRTLSLRLTIAAAEDLFEASTSLGAMSRRAADGVAMCRGHRLDLARREMIQSMFASPYSGSAKALFSESVALSLLAWQLTEAADSERRGISVQDRRRLNLARERLDASLDAPPTLIALAREVGLNDFKLKRDFKRVFGATVFGYVRRQRLLRAAVHLDQGLSVQAAALEVGYSCPSRFAQAFRRHHGISPGAFRRGGTDD